MVIASLMPDILKTQIALNLACRLNLKVAFLGYKKEKIIEVALKKAF